MSTSSAPDNRYRFDQFAVLDPTPRRPKGRPKKTSHLVTVSYQYLFIPAHAWIDIGCPGYAILRVHLPTKELHLMPASADQPEARTVLRPPPARPQDARYYLSPLERAQLFVGMYPYRIETVLDVPTIIITGAVK